MKVILKENIVKVMGVNRSLRDLKDNFWSKNGRGLRNDS